MTNEDEKVAVENETPEATQETEAPVETPAEQPIMAGEAMHKDKKDMKKEVRSTDWQNTFAAQMALGGG